ncbi:12830_t:CDS:2 [Racocetra fulgida]|uniref:12830_t:CDS:1 n=1 Tax=Racocetra fulgida TaxID=60492 RepID=A0A9N8VV17_9GLOM|nr:12830_t:CDS:2 [Racocetra fulgida]
MYISQTRNLSENTKKIETSKTRSSGSKTNKTHLRIQRKQNNTKTGNSESKTIKQENNSKHNLEFGKKEFVIINDHLFIYPLVIT